MIKTTYVSSWISCFEHHQLKPSACHHQPFPSQTAITEDNTIHGMFLLSLCHLFFFFHFILACSLAQGVGVLRPLQPASLFRALVDGSGSRAHFDRATTACVSSPRDWAVSVGSHMQQDMGISQAPPHPEAPFPWFDAVHFRKP